MTLVGSFTGPRGVDPDRVAPRPWPPAPHPALADRAVRFAPPAAQNAPR